MTSTITMMLLAALYSGLMAVALGGLQAHRRSAAVAAARHLPR